jgi:hypothetical protein
LATPNLTVKGAPPIAVWRANNGIAAMFAMQHRAFANQFPDFGVSEASLCCIAAQSGSFRCGEILWRSNQELRAAGERKEWTG